MDDELPLIIYLVGKYIISNLIINIIVNSKANTLIYDINLLYDYY
jgi:hypothetical protein